MKTTSVLVCAILALSIVSCSNKGKTTASNAEIDIAVFVPGVVSGSPVYEMLASGVDRAVKAAVAEGKKATVTVVEGGTKQADWGNGITSLCADGKDELIVSSNPAIPQILEPISAQFPKQSFLVFDSFLEGNAHITTFRYNQREQAYVSGYMAALVSSSSMKYANGAKKIGLVAGQEYPAMNGIILPAFLEGAKAVDPAFEVDFRVVGNWYDAARGAELAKAMYGAGCDVIMPISGGANQGVLSAAQEKGFYVAWFDDNGYAKAPGYVVSSSVMQQERLAFEETKAFLDGTLETGKAGTVGISGKYIDFVSDDPLWIENVPAPLRDRMTALLKTLYDGTLALPVQ
jgi:riboflavin transport system substrate-binding protein